MIAHHSISGCNMRVGDMLGSGTISGEDSSKNGGSLLELSWNGTRPFDLDGIKRTFLENGDTVTLSGGKLIPGTD
jgi:fumarylacetoacetase